MFPCSFQSGFSHRFPTSAIASWRSKRRAQSVCVTGESNVITVTSRPVVRVGNWQQQQADQRGSQPENNQADAIKGSEPGFHVIFLIHWFTPLQLTPLLQTGQSRRHGTAGLHQPVNPKPQTWSRRGPFARFHSWVTASFLCFCWLFTAAQEQHFQFHLHLLIVCACVSDLTPLLLPAPFPSMLFSQWAPWWRRRTRTKVKESWKAITRFWIVTSTF